jgi:hypothetical protein
MFSSAQGTSSESPRCHQRDFGADMPTPHPGQASPDYKNPDQNVADLKQPVTLPTNKARQGVLVRGMWVVLTVSTALAAIMLAVVYMLSQ